MNTKRMFRIFYRNLKKSKLQNICSEVKKTDVLTVINESPSISIRGISDKKINQIKDSLERQRIGSCFILDKKFDYAVRKIQKSIFPENKYRILTIENKIKVFKINY